MKTTALSILSILATVSMTVSAAVVNTTYRGTDGGSINDSANWNGNAPQYDAETNPETKLYFGTTKPSAAYGVKLTDDLTAYSTGFNYGLGLDVDLAGYTLQFVDGFRFDALSSHNNKVYWPGSTVTFHDGTLKALSADGETRKTIQFYYYLNSDGNYDGRNSSLILDNVTGVGNFYTMATNCHFTLRNGTKWKGGYSTYDGAKHSGITITGAGTVMDFANTSATVSGRDNANATNDYFIVTDHAVVTNLAGISSSGQAGYIEFSNGAQVYLPSTYNLSVGGNTKSADFKFTSGNRLTVRTANFSVSGSAAGSNVEIGGAGTVLETCEQYANGQTWSLQFAGNSTWVHDARLWVHDGAIITNRTGGVNIATPAANERRVAVELERGAGLYSAQTFEFGTSTSRDCSLKVDTESWLKCFRFRFGTTNSTTQVNKLWVGSGATVSPSGWAQLYGGPGCEVVISNGYLNVAQGVEVGDGYKIVFAGTNPRLKGEYVNWFGNVTLEFQIPAGGCVQERAMIRTTQSKQRTIGSGFTPVFKLKDFASANGGTVALAEGYNLAMSDSVMETWTQAANAGCEGRGTARLYFVQEGGLNKKLMLEVKPKKGFIMYVR